MHRPLQKDDFPLGKGVCSLPYLDLPKRVFFMPFREKLLFQTNNTFLRLQALFTLLLFCDNTRPNGDNTRPNGDFPRPCFQPNLKRRVCSEKAYLRPKDRHLCFFSKRREKCTLEDSGMFGGRVTMFLRKGEGSKGKPSLHLAISSYVMYGRQGVPGQNL